MLAQELCFEVSWPGRNMGVDVRALVHLENAMPDEMELLDLLTEIQQGGAMVVHLLDNGDRRGTVALRFEEAPHGRELVIIAVGGDPGLIHRFLPDIERIAIQGGAVAMRAHSAVGGIQRLMPRIGFREVERVYKKAVRDGR